MTKNKLLSKFFNIYVSTKIQGTSENKVIKLPLEGKFYMAEWKENRFLWYAETVMQVFVPDPVFCKNDNHKNNLLSIF